MPVRVTFQLNGVDGKTCLDGKESNTKCLIRTIKTIVVKVIILNFFSRWSVRVTHRLIKGKNWMVSDFLHPFTDYFHFLRQETENFLHVKCYNHFAVVSSLTAVSYMYDRFKIIDNFWRHKVFSALNLENELRDPHSFGIFGKRWSYRYV